MCVWGGGGGVGGQDSEYWWGDKRRGGGKLFTGCKLIAASASNQCQIITFLTMKTDIIAKFELKSKLLEIPSNKIKGTYIKLVHL